MKKIFQIIAVGYVGVALLAIGMDVLSIKKAYGKEGTKGGAQIWGENCARCHNMRSPSAHSDKQWEVISLHMRARANLTAEETKKILEFLKSAN